MRNADKPSIREESHDEKMMLSVVIYLFAAGLAPAAFAATGQQNEMKSCNKEADEEAQKGDEHKKVMSGSLKV
ncbi:MAG: hypothetical protein JSR83_21890 [Proteobacteria bacterium]|nr:hypothetical protein [Pseudomonadota bacterium]